jgi:hypothetical protein
LGLWGPQPSALTARGKSSRQSATASLPQTSLTRPEQRKASRRTPRRRRSARRRPRRSGLGVQRLAERSAAQRRKSPDVALRQYKPPLSAVRASVARAMPKAVKTLFRPQNEIGLDLVRSMPCQLALTVARLAASLSETTASARVAGTSAGWVALMGTACPSSKGLRNAPV